MDPQPKQLVLTAISNDINAIKAVNVKLMNAWKNDQNMIDEISKLLLTNRPSEDIFNYIPFRTEELNKYILSKVIDSRWSLKHLDPQLFTTELLVTVLARDYSDDLQYVIGKRNDLVNTSLIHISVYGRMSQNFKYIPDEFITVELCRKLVAKTLSNLQFVPNRYILSDVMDDKIMNYRDGWNHLKNRNVTPLIYKIVDSFINNPRKQRFRFVESCKEHELMELLEYYPHSYGHFTDNQKTLIITKRAVEVNPWNIKHVPDKHYTHDLFKLALSLEADVIKHKRS
jgi:hypothetical protein